MYSIAILGIDCYLRIKKYANFIELWTTKVVLSVLSIAFFFPLSQGRMATTGMVVRRDDIVVPVYFDALMLSVIVFFQVLTIRYCNTLYSESTIATSAEIKIRITKLSMRIMIMLCFSIAPLQIVVILKNIQDQLSDYGKSLPQFAVLISLVFFSANSFANAILFLNVEAKRLLRNLGRKKKIYK